MKIECLHFKAVNHQTLKAIAKVKIADTGAPFDIVINDVKMFQKGDRSWVSMPTNTYDKDGQKTYYKLVSFQDEEMDKKIMGAIHECVSSRLKESGNRSAQDEECPF